ncbi:hypothetical protein MLD38_009286 [Melastoma candidum]|uniref:Uncharacterized protein n=1 Tax=Melastoma candidum TaxID=119954 RepID=A0ACB9S5L0_9MYRT|nr:hypothetical protein MLD38_009286 [Melastoma candidum]
MFPTAFLPDPLPFSSFEDFPDGFFTEYEPSPDPKSISGPDGPSLDHYSPNCNSAVSLEHSSPAVTVMDERKRRRMLSNRESARRSRVRRQKHLESVRDQVNRLRLENQEISTRLTMILYHGRCLGFENSQLRSDNLNLRQKLSEVCDLMLLGQSPQQQGLILPTN